MGDIGLLNKRSENDTTEGGSRFAIALRLVGVLVIAGLVVALIGALLLPRVVDGVTCRRELSSGVAVRGLAGMTEAEARDVVNRASECLSVTVERVPSDPEMDGRVLEPRAGLLSHGEVSLVVGDGPR